MRILGIDYGEARTGLAISDEGEQIATAVGTLHERDKARLAERIAAFCTERGVQKIVLGLPKNMDGTEGFRAEATRRFAALLAERMSGCPICFTDERLTSMMAARFLEETNTRGKKKKNAIDALSAEIILQDYLDGARQGVL